MDFKIVFFDFRSVKNGFEKVGWNIGETKVWKAASNTFPGIGSEFMPTLNEGSFLLMPTAMPHVGVEESKNIVQKLDILIANIPEVENAVGKLGRVESAIDPAPISMFENIINYKSEFIANDEGKPKRFKVDKNEKHEKKKEKGSIEDTVVTDEKGNVIGDDEIELVEPSGQREYWE